MTADASPSVLAGIGWVPRRRFDVDAYYRMAEAGILREKERVELIEGEIIALEPMRPAEAGTVTRLTYTLMPNIDRTAILTVRKPLRLSRISEAMPDLALLRDQGDFYRSAHPTAADVLLLIEVAQSSLRYDRGVKLPLYARHGVPEVWIVDIGGRVVEVHRNPQPEGYAASTTHAAGDTLEPALLPGLRIGAGDILG